MTVDSDFLRWIADRLQYYHHENPNVDYMLKLRNLVEALDKSPVRLSGWRILHGNEVYLCGDHQHFIDKIKELERAGVKVFRVERP